MAKIFYFVTGEGLGHATRSIPIINYLKKHHNIIPFSSNRSFKILKTHFSNAKKVIDFELIYIKDKINLKKTILYNLKKLYSIFKIFKKLKYYIKKEKPDLIISDFSIWPKLIKTFLGINFITIDNNHFGVKAKIKKLNFYEWFKLNIYTKFFVSNNELNVILSFCDIKHNKKTILINPIVRDKLIELKKKLKNRQIIKKNHILVYQTSNTYPNLIKKLKLLDHNFIVYGMDKNDRRNIKRLNIFEDKKIKFKSFNETEFFNDLATSKAIITNGGFSLISEAIFLNKAIMSVPVKNQYEQLLNSYYLNKNNLGFFSKSINKKQFNLFLNKIEFYEKKLKANNTYEVQTSLILINKIITDIIKKNKK